MGLLDRLFGRKSAAQHLDRGEKLLAAGKYAEARMEFEDASEALTPEEEDLRQLVAVRLLVARRGLAELNLEEAEHALNAGEREKAAEHVEMVLSLTEDGELRQKAEFLKGKTLESPAPVHASSSSRSCSGCSPGHAAEPVNPELHEGEMLPEARYELYIHSLPGDLPGRYAALGKEFASAVLASQDEEYAMASQALRKMAAAGENDIVLYELATALCHSGNGREAEKLLSRARQLNRSNPLVPMTTVDLYLHTGRIAEARGLLEEMVEEGLLPEQATFLLGDVLLHQGEEEQALERFRPLLASPALKKEAAGRIVAILEKQNRSGEAAAVRKQYLQGCC